MAAVLVSEDQATVHLRLGTPLSAEIEADLLAKLQQANDAILDFLGPQINPLWDTTSVPSIVQAAILLYLTNLWEHRGDDGAPSDADNACWLAIERLLRRLRMPVIA
jgi:hypothetical protein